MNFSRFRQVVILALPRNFSFINSDPTKLASAVVASIVADDVLGLSTVLAEAQNLSVLYAVNKLLGLNDIDLGLLKSDCVTFFKNLQRVTFGVI